VNAVGRRISLGLALYTLILGLLGGMLVERMRFDRARADTLERFREAEHRLHDRLMAIERQESGLPRK
jgi:hypothetical protein